MKKITLLLILIAITNSIYAQLINEFEPNPQGVDPSNQNIEIKGTAGQAFTGYILSIESDPGTTAGLVDEINMVSGTFDSNGLLVVTIPDMENPSFTIVLTDSFTGDETTDIDSDDDGIVDDISTIGTVYDSIGIADTSGDLVLLYADDFGGANLPATFEPTIMFRDPNTSDIFYSNTAGTVMYDQSGTVVDSADFAFDPFTTTYGSDGPVYNGPPLNNEEFLALKNETTLYPNPATKGKVVLKTPLTSQVEVNIFTSLGTIVSTQTASSSKAFSTEGLDAGVYFVQLTVDGNTTTKRLVVQ